MLVTQVDRLIDTYDLVFSNGSKIGHIGVMEITTVLGDLQYCLT